MRFIRYEAFRFLIAGSFNTVVTYLIYLLLLRYLDYKIAFTISFLGGVCFTLFLHSYFVFKSVITLKNLLQFPLFYITQYAVGLALLFFLINYLEVDQRIAPLVNVVLLTPINFFISRWLFPGRAN